MKRLLEVDNLDDRREIYRLLQFLPPKWRWAWLAWVCGMPKVLSGDLCFDAEDLRQTKAAEWGCPKGDKYVTNQCYRLAFMQVAAHALDWAKIEEGLTLLARRKIRPADLRNLLKM